jgi:toxin ParE1/3/4
MALRFHPDARAELDSARRRYRVLNVDTARRFAEEMLDILERIETNPSQFPEYGLLTVDTSLRPLFFCVRKAVLPRTFPYVVFFYVRQDTAVVLAVAHCRRRPSYWSRRA